VDAAVVTLVGGGGWRQEWPKRRWRTAAGDGKWAGGHFSGGQAAAAVAELVGVVGSGGGQTDERRCVGGRIERRRW